MRTNQRPSERGGLNWVTAMLLLIVVGALGAAVLVGPKTLANYSLRHEMERLLLNAKKMTDAEMIRGIQSAAQREGVPLPADQSECHRTYDKVFCQYHFEWPVTIGGKELFKMNFEERGSSDLQDVSKKILEL
jgi:hypothetical protein